MNAQVSIKEIIKDFIYIGSQLKELFKGREEFQPIIDFLIAKDYFDEDLDLPYPKFKDLELGTGIKTHMLRKHLTKMHSEIFTYERKLNLSFRKVIYHFYITYYNHSCQFSVDHLTHLPKVGDTINLPFVSALIPINYFYVENIMHQFENNTQVIIITLKVGQYNKYYKFMKDKALELGDLSFSETYDLSESEIKKIIYARTPFR